MFNQKDLNFIDLALIFVIIMTLYSLIKEVFRKKFFGKVLISKFIDKGTRNIMIYWGLLGCLWIYFFVFALTRNTMTLYFQTVWIFMCCLMIKRCYHNGEVREKGIASRDGFIPWKKVVKYRWVENGKLEVTMYGINQRFSSWKTIKDIAVNKNERGKIDMIINRNINKN